jgi:SAM-dependent methyltransferase
MQSKLNGMSIRNKIGYLTNEQSKFYFLKNFYYKISVNNIPYYSTLCQLIKNKKGFEVGGPSLIFKDTGCIPIYRHISYLDGCNFSTNTLWEGDIDEGDKFNFYKQKIGRQFIAEATNLSFINDETYGFFLSSNCLEHIANPLLAVKEWIRIINKDGIIVLVLPNKEYNFDHQRPITEFKHLVLDYENEVGEDDLSHLNEILELHDLSLDPPAGSYEQFKERSLNNLQNRALHHHVFDMQLLKDIFCFFKLEILFTHSNKDHIIIGKKC